MTEVPIIFPSNLGSPHRFVVNDAKCTIIKRQNGSGANEKMAPLLLDDVSTQAVGCGSASMSCLNFQTNGVSSMLLTTSVLLENPRILSVAASSAGNSPDSPIIVELDLVSEIKTYGNTVKVQAFVEARKNGQECIRLVLVADNAVIVTVRLQPNNLAPIDRRDCVEVFNVRDLLNEDPATKEAVSGSLIHKTMVASYSPTKLVMALSPLLMSVDLQSKSCEVWLESQCLEDMRARASTIGSIFSKASDLLLGRLDDGSLVDMAPTAALCVSSTANPLLDPTFVFTLHSDGKIKRWIVSDASLRPMEVYPITIDLPNPRDWSDLYNSAYLCARLYSQVYVLGVHIQTSSGSSSMMVDDEDGKAGLGSSSRLYAVYGGKDSTAQTGEPVEMAVPREAMGLVDMDFSPNSNGCSLTAMFRSNTRDQYGAPTTLTVTYPTSVVAIISTQPETAPIDYFLDGVAQSERARIGALVFNDELEGFATSNIPTAIEDEIHEMDRCFLKYLFRPAYPRGSGTVTPPKDIHVRNALQKVVAGRMMRQNDGAPSSIQLETLRAMQEWRARENRQVLTASSPQKSTRSASQSATSTIGDRPASTKTSALSVYDSYVANAFDDGEENDDAELSDSELDQLERERVFLLEMHSRRWRRLLLAIWEEEQFLRFPVGFFLLGNFNVLIRSGFTSLLFGMNAGGSGHTLAQLDRAALKLIDALESHDESCKKLIGMEQRIWNNMAKAQDETTPSDFAEGFSIVVDSAFDSTLGSVFSVREQQQLGQALGEIPHDDYFVLLQDTPQNKNLPGLNLIDTNDGGLVQEPTTPRNFVANNQIRLAVCALSVRCVDSSRRLLLARYLLLSYLVKSSHVSTIAFYTYLRVLAVMWAGSQPVSMPPAFAGSSSAKGLSDQPPKKRLSFGDSSNGILENSSSTTSMDALLISMLQSRSNAYEASSTSLVLALCRDLFCSSMRSTVPEAANVALGKLSVLLPELGALPPSSSPSIATDHPLLALRLIAPLVALGPGKVAPNVVAARRETLAECLLLESHKQLSEKSKSKMRVRACELLASNPGETGNLKEAMQAFNFLKNRTMQQQLSESALKSLAQILQQMIYGAEGEIRREINRLVEMETVKMLFGCLLKDAQHVMTSDVNKAVQLLLPRLQHLSNLMHRMDILEHHVGRSKGSNDFILTFINNAIREVKDSFPVEVCESMPEYLSLYNRLFHNAVSCKEWNQAYDACLCNPSVDRKVSNFKRLVTSMVDAGALRELMSKCSTLASPTSGLSTAESVDLYSIAADALGEACSRDLYLVRANAVDAAKAAPDYQGSLYSLHASQGQWRRAAQSLDLRYVNAMRSLATAQTQQSQGSSNTAKIRERLIVEDLILASVGTANAVALVDDAAAQYIVSGEQGQLPSIQVEVLEALESSSTKRGRESGPENLQQEHSSLDRISQFMTLQDLQGRATWSLALRKICLDNSASSIQTSALLDHGNACVSKNALEELSDTWGYYFNCLLLTLAMSKTGSKGGSVRNAFQDSLLNLLHQMLVPMSCDCDSSNVKSRPSISQISRCLDSVGALPGSAPFVRGCRFKDHSTAIQTCLQELSSKLVKKLSILHTNAEHPVGLHVANCILEYDDKIAQLPHWLERLLMVGSSDGVESSTHCDGLFDKRPKPGDALTYLGDPSALLTLYLRQGMLLEACAVVVEALSGGNVGDGKGKTRLPEKGDIVFVPYKKIDVLWNLMESAMGKRVDEETRAKLRKGQEILVGSLQKHLDMMKTNEMGLRSARALNQQQHFLS